MRHRWQVLRLPPLLLPVPLWRGGFRPDVVHDEPRVAAMATAQTPHGELLVATTHLSFLRGWNVVQLRRVVRVVSAYTGPAIILGDLNMQPALAHRVTGMVPLATEATFPADAPQRQIDHVLGRGLTVSGTGEAVGFPLSDHLALAVDLPNPGD